MTEELSELYSDPEMGNSIRSLAYESIRPQMETCEITTDFSNIKDLYLPEFPLEDLRTFVLEALEFCVPLQRSTLTLHQQSIHEGKRYPCLHCDYVVAQKNHLTLHKQSKNEGKIYPFPHCDY